MRKRFETYMILGLYFAVGVLLGFFAGKGSPKKPNSVVIEVVKERDEILIYEYFSGKLVFEYSKNKKVDKNAYKEYSDLLKELSE